MHSKNIFGTIVPSNLNISIVFNGINMKDVVMDVLLECFPEYTGYLDAHNLADIADKIVDAFAEKMSLKQG